MSRTLDQILEQENPEIVARARKKADALLLDLRLADFRERVHKTQVEMAEAMGVKQPTIANIEKPGRDMKISSLKRYVEAAGGKLRLVIELPDGSHYGFPL